MAAPAVQLTIQSRWPTWVAGFATFRSIFVPCSELRYDKGMSTAPTNTTAITAAQLLPISTELKIRGLRCELLKGELRTMSPAGGEHGALSAEILYLLTDHVRKHNLGRCFGAETGFIVGRDPDTVIAPDAAFVRQARVAELGIPKKFFPEAPALAVEVVSPSESKASVHEKACTWLEAGCETVWIIWPDDHSVTVYNSAEDIRQIGSDEKLDGGNVIAGFSVAVASLFA